jgi:FtsZ-binding cell division protein ZapB
MEALNIMTLADDFCRNFYAGDIKVITPPEDLQVGGDPLIHKAMIAAHAIIRSNLGDAIHVHITQKSESSAQNLVRLITTARDQGLIAENEAYMSKSKRLEQENENLKELNNKLARENDHLKKQVTALHETIARLTASGISRASGGNP